MKKNQQNSPVLMFENWMYGIFNKDFNKFKDGYSNDYWNSISEKQKVELLNTYKSSFASAGIENYVAEDFVISYEGSDTLGELSIIYKDKKLPLLKVKNVAGDWILAEK